MSKDNLVSLGTARAIRDRDASMWSPCEALRYLLDEIESGRLNPNMIYVAMRADSDNAIRFPYVAAGTSSWLEQIGLLQQHIYFLQKDGT